MTPKKVEFTRIASLISWPSVTKSSLMNWNPLPFLQSCILFPKYCLGFALKNLIIQFICIFGGICNKERFDCITCKNSMKFGFFELQYWNESLEFILNGAYLFDFHLMRRQSYCQEFSREFYSLEFVAWTGLLCS